MNRRMLFGFLVSLILIIVLVVIFNSDDIGFKEKDKIRQEVGNTSVPVEKDFVENKTGENDTFENGGGTSAPSSSLNLELSIKDSPKLNQVGELEAIVRTYVYDSRVKFDIDLPESIQLIDGNLSWYGDVIIPPEELEKHSYPYDPGERVAQGNITRKIKFKPTQSGDWKIIGRLSTLKPNSTEIWGTSPYETEVFLSVSENLIN